MILIEDRQVLCVILLFGVACFLMGWLICMDFNKWRPGR